MFDETWPFQSMNWCYGREELGNDALEFLENDIPATTLAINTKRLVSIKECFVFFRECRQRKKETWLHSLSCDHPRFADRGLHQAPKHWKDLKNTKDIVHASRSVSCLSNHDLFFGGIHTDGKCQYGVEVYSPQFASRKFGLVQAIPEIRYGSMNKGSPWRNMGITPQEVKTVRIAWRSRGKNVRVPPYKPTPLYTPIFHEFWENKIFLWLLEYAKLLYTTAFKDCPIDDKARRGIYAEEIEASPEAGSDRPSPTSGEGSLEGKDGGRTSVPPPPSQPSSSNLDPRHKGKALLIEEEDEEEDKVHFQRKRRAPTTPTTKVESESAPIEASENREKKPRVVYPIEKIGHLKCLKGLLHQRLRGQGKRRLKSPPLLIEKPDEALGAVVDKLRGLWTLFKSPNFDLVQNPDAFSKMQHVLIQVEQVKPHLAPAC
ncbi:unnamed protein product [Prunus armeniaca]|uniref:Aminotransferase-like plant mobile domain-containing protein n=1 Tax=Prunus armeniaca TaxID=36596 RepID=A0A6J5VD13_PRUAR|nr:unnamed protein product [Prunus armeniaca]